MQNRRWIPFAALEFLDGIENQLGMYLTVFLLGCGWTASQTGMLNAINALILLFALPMWGMISDRLRSSRVVYVTSLLVGGLIYALVPVIVGKQPPFWVLVLYLMFMCVFKNVCEPLAENWLVPYAAEQNCDYGLIRTFGSLGWMLMGFALAFILPRTGETWTFPGFAIAAAITALFAFRVSDSNQKKDAAKPQPRLLLRVKPYVLFLPFMLILYAVVYATNGFLPYLFRDAGTDANMISLSSAYIGLIEIVLLFFSKKIREKFSLRHLCIISGTLFGLSALLLGLFGHSLVIILAILTLFGTANGILIFSAYNYVYSISPASLKATAQTTTSAVSSAGGILGNLIIGRLIDASGTGFAFLLLGIFGLIAAAYLALTARAAKT